MIIDRGYPESIVLKEPDGRIIVDADIPGGHDGPARIIRKIADAALALRFRDEARIVGCLADDFIGAAPDMKKMFDEQYKPASGNTVKLEVDFIPWPDFYTRVNASLTSGEQKYNMAVSDSQWLGAFVEGGYYRKINDLIDADPELKAAMDGMHPSILAAYSTYPHKTPNYYGFPQFPDVLVNFVRKDIVCNEEEQKNFQAKFNKKLPCTPEELDDMEVSDVENTAQARHSD